jgi:hypothetical protein
VENGVDVPVGGWELTDMHTYTYARNGAVECRRTEESTYAPTSIVGSPVYPAWTDPPRGGPACFDYAGTDVVVNHQLAESTLPQDFAPQSTDATVIDPKTDDAYAAHTYRQTPCPCTVVMKIDRAPQVEVVEEGMVRFRFSDEAYLTELDYLTFVGLSSMSAALAHFGEDGTISCLLPPGTTVETEPLNGMVRVTIIFPTDCGEE